MHLAQVNIAELIGSTDDPRVADFINALDEINALAEQTDGFIWRMVGEGNNATDIRFSDTPNLLINMSVWRDIDSLYNYVYKTHHNDFFRRRREWFKKWDRPSPVLWWIPEGHIPTIEEALERVNHMHEHGPTPYAFNFKQKFTDTQSHQE